MEMFVANETHYASKFGTDFAWCGRYLLNKVTDHIVETGEPTCTRCRTHDGGTR